MSRLIVHLGAHKTGTTLIQKYLNTRADALARRGVDFIGWHEAHRLIDWGTRLTETPNLFRRRICDAVSNGRPTILISHENMLGRPFLSEKAGLYPEAGRFARLLSEICSDFDLHIIFYVRPVADFVESYYLQTIREGAFHHFHEWLGRFDVDGFGWSPVIRVLDDVFGPEGVSLGDFREIRDGQETYLRNFFLRSRLTAPANVSFRRVRNPSLSARGLRISLEVNRHLETPEERLAVRRFMEKNFSNHRQERATPMPPDLRSYLDERTSGEYAALATRAADALNRAGAPIEAHAESRGLPIPAGFKKLLPGRALRR